MWRGFNILAADAHMHEPQDMRDKYVEAPFRDVMPRVVGMNGVFFVYEYKDGAKKADTGAVPPASAWEEMEQMYGEAFRIKP